MDPYADIAAVNDEELTEADKQEIIDSVMDHLVSLAVIENKLMETGHHDFTPDETDILRAAAASQYESTWANPVPAGAGFRLRCYRGGDHRLDG